MSFAATRYNDGVEEEFLIYTGSKNFVTFVLPVGLYNITAEIHENAGAFAYIYADSPPKKKLNQMHLIVNI